MLLFWMNKPLWFELADAINKTVGTSSVSQHTDDYGAATDRLPRWKTILVVDGYVE
jgi:hypothetical protein